MAMIKVYNWKRWSIQNDDYPVSKQKGTREAIEKKGLIVVEETEEEIDDSQLEIDGFMKPSRK
jgi:hypothetical protein